MILAIVRKVPYFTEAVKNKTKFHITIGHQTAIGHCIFFTANDPERALELGKEIEAAAFNKAALNSAKEKLVLSIDTTSTDYAFVDEIKAPKLAKQGQEEEKKQQQGLPIYYAAIKLEKEIYVQHQTLLIASKLDKDIAAKQCRLAFYG